ncbi:MAG: glycosyltransferase family 39 protein [Rhodocyclaceae bacterium]|nr:glycosyltransferase family 39 protein [Rhodocyclaceae bacterium]
MKKFGAAFASPALNLFIALALIFRFWLAAVTPITGDEAYFIWWGWRPDWGFYDHPPMIGWWLAALLMVSDSEWWLRLPVILQPVILALSVRWALPKIAPNIDDGRRDLIALLILLAPANLWNIAITTDTPLIYFSVFSGLAWLRATQDGDLRWYVAAGFCLTGAVLSKYFVAFLGFAFLIDVLRRRTIKSWVGLAIVYACCIPALALMAWWNSANCWPNYMFNFVNRHESAGWSATTPLLYVVSVLYLLTPPMVWLVFREFRQRVGARRSRHPAMQSHSTNWRIPSLSVLAIVPFALFAVLSLVKQIGLHWLLSFVPFALIWLGLRLAPETLQKLARFFVGFAVVHVLVIVTIAVMPLETWKSSRRYDGVVLTFAYEEVNRSLASTLADKEKNWVIAMDGYSNAVTLGYNLRRYVMVFGEASSHARHDDILTDFRALKERNILVLRKTEPDLVYYQQFFRKVSVDSFIVRGARFWQVKGEGFDYAAYREKVLLVVKKKYYSIPPWLPQRGCYFCERYFPDEA